MNPDASPSDLRSALHGFDGNLLIYDELTAEGAKPVAGALRTASYEDLWSEGGEMKRVRIGLEDPIVALLGERHGLLYHSHLSLVAGGLSWSTFVNLRERQGIFCPHPIYSWEGLYSLLAALFRGGFCLFDELEGQSLPTLIQRYRPVYAFLDSDELEKVPAHRRLVSAFAGVVDAVFVSGHLSRRRRQRARNHLQAEILTVYGSLRLGAVIASHPSWYLDRALGIPVTNVDLWPLDPATKTPLDVSWEAIAYAEIGVKSPMIAPSALEEGKEWTPAGLVATMDPNGFYYLLERPPA